MGHRTNYGESKLGHRTLLKIIKIGHHLGDPCRTGPKRGKKTSSHAERQDAVGITVTVVCASF